MYIEIEAASISACQGTARITLGLLKFAAYLSQDLGSYLVSKPNPARHLSRVSGSSRLEQQICPSICPVITASQADLSKHLSGRFAWIYSGFDPDCKTQSSYGTGPANYMYIYTQVYNTCVFMYT